MYRSAFRAGAVALAMTVAGPALAAPVVDASATADADYGAVKASVAYDANAPRDNFGTPTGASNASAYTISLTSDANFVYGLLVSDRNTGNAFANLYFNRPSGGNSLGFEIGRNGVGIFVPGSGSPAIAVSSSLYQTAFSADNRVIEFALSNSLFSGPTAGLPGQSPASNFATPGSDLRLNLSQSFGYSVAGGAAAFGTNRLGVVTFGGANVSAVPEPATWGLMLLGFGAVGAGARYRRRRTRSAFA